MALGVTEVHGVPIQGLAQRCADPLPDIVERQAGNRPVPCSPDFGDGLEADHAEGIEIANEPAHDIRNLVEVLPCDREGMGSVELPTRLGPHVADQTGIAVSDRVELLLGDERGPLLPASLGGVDMDRDLLQSVLLDQLAEVLRLSEEAATMRHDHGIEPDIERIAHIVSQGLARQQRYLPGRDLSLALRTEELAEPIELPQDLLLGQRIGRVGLLPQVAAGTGEVTALQDAVRRAARVMGETDDLLGSLQRLRQAIEARAVEAETLGRYRPGQGLE